MTLRVLIVDDEPLAREGVALCLQPHLDVAIVASCSDGTEAIRAIRELAPDLVFLDIKMPGLSGFDVVEAIGVEHMPRVIFVTAHDDHALRAFRVAAVDYVLKPVDPSRLNEALNRARRSLSHNDLLERTRALASALERLEHRAPVSSRDDRIVIRSGGNMHFLPPEDVLRVEAAGDYVTVHTKQQQHLVRESMRDMELRLAPHGFMRVHRSSLVCVARIRELEVCDSGDCEIVLDNGTRLKVGRAYKDALLSALNARS